MINWKCFLCHRRKISEDILIATFIVFFSASLMYANIVGAEAKNVGNGTTETAQVKENLIQKIKEPEVPATVTESQTHAPPVAVTTPVPKKTYTKSAYSTTSSGQPTASSAPANVSSEEKSIALNGSGITSQINYQRRLNGLGNVSLNGQLSSAALAKARDMYDKNYFAHVAPDGTDDFYFVNLSGYAWTSVGVNLATGSFGDAKDLVNAWMASPGHKANILASYGRNVGVGIYGKYFVMVIAN